MEKNIRKYWVFIVEVLIAFILLLFCFKSNEVVYEIINGDLQIQENGSRLQTGKIGLKPAVYRVTIEYFTDDLACNMYLETEADKNILADQVPLNNIYYSKEFNFWVLKEIDDLEFIISKGQPDTDFEVKSMRIELSKQTYFLMLFGFLLLCQFLNSVIWLVKTYRQQGIKAISVPVILFGLVVLNTIISSGDQIKGGIDLNFHLYRIEGIAAALSQGQFPVRMQPLWMNNYGYASSIFYGELFLYLPAILRLIGMPGEWSFNIFVMVFHAITIYSCYFSFKKMTGKSEIGIVGAILISFCQYRMMDLSYRGAIGEWQAFAFVPLVICGLYKIFTDNPTDKSYKSNYLIAVLGFSGLIQTHILSSMMVGMFTILACLLYIYKVFQLKRFIELCKIVITTIFLNLWFIIPMLDFMRDKFCFNDGSRDYNKIQQYGISINRVFNFSIVENQGLIPAALGLGIGLICVGFILWEILGRQNKKREATKGIYWIWGMALLAIFLSTDLFPYDYLKKFEIINKVIVGIQFPWRFLLVAMALITTAICLSLNDLKQELMAVNYKVVIYGISILGILVGVQYDYVGEKKFFYEEEYYDTVGIDSFSQIAGEYVPSGTDVSYLTNPYVYNLDGNVYVSDYFIDKGIVEAVCENVGGMEGKITVPILYYRGYEAVDIETNMKCEITKDDNNSLQVIIPPDYIGTVRIKFESFWYWRLMEVISFISIIIFIFISIKNKKYSKIVT